MFAPEISPSGGWDFLLDMLSRSGCLISGPYSHPSRRGCEDRGTPKKFDLQARHKALLGSLQPARLLDS